MKSSIETPPQVGSSPILTSEAWWASPVGQAFTGVPSVSIPHNNMLDIMWMVPVNNLLERIPYLKKIKTSPQELREKIGFFAENHVLGFILGL